MSYLDKAVDTTLFSNRKMLIFFLILYINNICVFFIGSFSMNTYKICFCEKKLKTRNLDTLSIMTLLTVMTNLLKCDCNVWSSILLLTFQRILLRDYMYFKIIKSLLRCCFRVLILSVSSITTVPDRLWFSLLASIQFFILMDYPIHIDTISIGLPI